MIDPELREYLQPAVDAAPTLTDVQVVLLSEILSHSTAWGDTEADR